MAAGRKVNQGTWRLRLRPSGSFFRYIFNRHSQLSHQEIQLNPPYGLLQVNPFERANKQYFAANHFRLFFHCHSDCEVKWKWEKF